MNDDGHTSSIRDKILTITVKKGWRPGTRITFPQEGDQGPNNVPGIQNNKLQLLVLLIYSAAILVSNQSHVELRQTDGIKFLLFTADIVFIVKDKPHPRFRRSGVDLIYTAKIPLGKALTGCMVEVLTLDERIINIPINDIVQ